MRTPYLPLTVALALTACVAGGQKRPAKRPPARVVMGTAQLPGDNGKLGQAYTLGDSERVNLVLTGVRYGKARWVHGEEAIAPSATQKLLILSYQIQNPNPSLTRYEPRVLTFTAIDDAGVNHEAEAAVATKGDAKSVYVQLKPAQRIDCETAIRVPAKGTIPKLMILPRIGGRVLRVDLRGHVAPLAPPYSADGHDALATVPGKPGVAYALLGSDVRYVSTAFQAHQVGDTTCTDDQVFMLAKMGFAARAPGRSRRAFHGEAVDADGEHHASTGLIRASTEGPMGTDGTAGEEVTGRMLFVVPKGAKIVKLRVWEGDYDDRSSAIEYPLGATATP